MIIRPFTIITGLLFVLSGALMFVVKHQSQMLTQQVSDTNQATAQDEQSIRVLQAQWALEADPSRLAALATQFTGLQPMKPGQLVTMASLGSSLPAPGAKPPGSNPEDPVPALPQFSAPAPAAVAATIPAAVSTPGPAPAQFAAQTATPAPVTPVPAAPVHLAAATPAAVPTHHFTPERLASAAPVHHAVTVRHYTPSSVYMADASTAAPVAHGMLMGAQLVPVRAVAAPAPAPMPADDGGSLLGMAQDGSQ